jgi:N-acyl-D-aspartate/D-glutamate deacylase
MAPESEYDLVVRNAVIVDGLGPSIEGDAAVRDGLVA